MLKSRVVARNYRDAAAKSVPTTSPTVSRWAQRAMLCIAAMCPSKSTYLRDISQAYTQSESKLAREVYLEAPSEFGVSEEFVLRAVRPLYGIPEAGLYWFKNISGDTTSIVCICKFVKLMNAYCFGREKSADNDTTVFI